MPIGKNWSIFLKNNLNLKFFSDCLYSRQNDQSIWNGKVEEQIKIKDGCVFFSFLGMWRRTVLRIKLQSFYKWLGEAFHEQLNSSFCSSF